MTSIVASPPAPSTALLNMITAVLSLEPDSALCRHAVCTYILSYAKHDQCKSGLVGRPEQLDHALSGALPLLAIQLLLSPGAVIQRKGCPA